MRLLILFIHFLTFSFACTTAKQATPTTVGFVPLNNYVLNPGLSFQDDINYTFIGNENEFYKMFSLTKSSPGSVIIPDFATRSVVAIIFKPTDKVVSAEVNKTTISGNQLNVYYTFTDTTSWKNYLHTPMVVATVPRNNSVKKVSFYSHGVKEKTIAANY